MTTLFNLPLSSPRAPRRVVRRVGPRVGPRVSQRLRAGLTAGLVLLWGVAGAGEPWRGRVEAVDPAARRLVLAGTESGAGREVTAGAGDLGWIRPGREVRGELAREGTGWRLERVWPAGTVEESVLRAAARRLRRDTESRGARAFRGVGEYLPPFALLDQRGEICDGARLRGRYGVVCFIFTRCTAPTMCPATTARLGELGDLARTRGVEDLHLILASFDPEFDTPGVLAEYASAHGLLDDRYLLLTGPTEAADDLRAQLGILAEPDPQQIIRHTLMATVFDPSGRILYQVPGGGWSAADLLDRIQAHRSASPGKPAN